MNGLDEELGERTWMICKQSDNKQRKTKGLNTQGDNEGMGNRMETHLGEIKHD